MNDELWIKRPCEHGRTNNLLHAQSTVPGGCRGGSEERLDPDRVLTLRGGGERVWDGYVEVEQFEFTVQDILDALGEP